MINNTIIVGTGFGNNRAVKIKLLAINPHCYHCGKLCIDYGIIPELPNNPHDMATIDHLKSRFFRKDGEKVGKVLSCYQCNHERAHEENVRYQNKKFSTLSN